MSDARPRIALLGHGPVGQWAGEAILAAGWNLVFVHAHEPASGDWQPGLAPLAAAHSIPCDVELGAGSGLERGLARHTPDLLVSAYCRTILAPEVLQVAPLGGVNLHGSLLPHYRGRAPVNWMVLAGEQAGGVSLHKLTRRVDRGPLLGQRRFPIGAQETAFELLMKVAEQGAQLLMEVLPGYLQGTPAGVPQGAGTIFGRRTPEDGRLDCRRPAHELFNLIRAVTRPYPGAFVEWRQQRLTIWWAEPAFDCELPAGELALVDRGLYLGTGSTPLRLVDWTLEGCPAGKTAGALAEACQGQNVIIQKVESTG